MNSAITVSQLNRYMSFKLKEDANLHNRLIKGEISGFTNHAKTGHFYFTLKDSTSAVKAIMFNNFAARLPFVPYNGMSVAVMASVQVFERDGIYQLYVTDMLPDGDGAVYMAIEQLKRRLADEGLFDERFKQPLPKFPKRVGIVTSRDAAALRDILNILGRRYPICEAVIFPCLVQGDYAPDSICEALNTADESGCDVIICGRGGGSPEDLMAFSNEKVVRAVFAANKPIISAVGHETDIALTDFAADLRAPTPSAAAELAVPDISVLKAAVSGKQDILREHMAAAIENRRLKVIDAQRKLKVLCPDNAIKRSEELLGQRELTLETAIKSFLDKKQSNVIALAVQLDALSPLKVMGRGYSLVYGESGLIRSAKGLEKESTISVRFADGSSADAVVESICDTDESEDAL